MDVHVGLDIEVEGDHTAHSGVGRGASGGSGSLFARGGRCCHGAVDLGGRSEADHLRRREREREMWGETKGGK